ncbi:TPA: transposase, partial [Enterococcus faecium]|nr:transposase [Enterococcus faecium]HCA4886524.1 transposase [Enterococcus faecium]HEJ0240257.1 transposase [Enterococcus faecium]
HTSCDDNGFILSTIITPGNIHDSQVAFQLVKQSKRLFPEINCVVADAGYKTPKFVHFLTHLNLRPCLPYSRPKGKKGLLSKNEFLYDEYFDCYICPQDQMLAFSTVTRERYREYKSNPKECVNCPLLNQCTKSKNHQRVITRHVWGDLMDEVEHLRLTDLNKSIYKKRKQTIERIFADAKEKHGMRWTKYRGLEKVATHTMLVFAAMNLKKLATWLWKGKEPLFFCSKIRNEVDKKLFQARVTSLEQLLSTVCDVGDISFSIRNQLRFKRSLPVSGNINVYFTKARFKRLIAITVSSIVMFLWLFRMGVIP